MNCVGLGTLGNSGPFELCCISMVVVHSSLEDAVNCLELVGL